MNALERFVASPPAHAIGWAILYSLWEGGAAALLVGTVLLVTRSPRWRYATACVALFLMVCGFGFTLAHFLPDTARNAQRVLPPRWIWNSTNVASATGPWQPSLATVVPWTAPVWLCGVLLIYARALGSCWWVQRLRRRGLCAPPPPWLSELARLKALLRVSRPVQLLESSLTEVPLVAGHFRPLILIPVGLLTGLTVVQVEAILLHELAHIRRHDYLLNLLQRLAEGVLFYHPAAWWISRVIRVERENCCDDMVVSVTGNAREYAQMLAALEQNRFAGGRPAVVAATGGALMKRIQRLLYPKGPNVTWTPLLTTAVTFAVVAILLAAWPSPGADSSAIRKDRQDATDAVKLEKQAKDSATETLERYAKWLDQDVVYIIDDAERAAFRSLQTNTERDKFIEQFWERRNPHPGSSTNAFKEEHYRRISFANQRFATASGTSGWRTDRGHIYIVYGPPDEIDSHPKDGPKPGIENWLYRHVEGVGDNATITFMDRTGRGDYHLAPGSPH